VQNDSDHDRGFKIVMSDKNVRVLGKAGQAGKCPHSRANTSTTCVYPNRLTRRVWCGLVVSAQIKVIPRC